MDKLLYEDKDHLSRKSDTFILHIWLLRLAIALKVIVAVFHEIYRWRKYWLLCRMLVEVFQEIIMLHFLTAKKAIVFLNTTFYIVSATHLLAHLTQQYCQAAQELLLLSVQIPRQPPAQVICLIEEKNKQAQRWAAAETDNCKLIEHFKHFMYDYLRHHNC